MKKAKGQYAHDRMMSDDSMIASLYYQAQAIWPKERQLFEQLGLHHLKSVVDLGCGTGELIARLVEHYQFERIVGVDLLENRIKAVKSQFRQVPHVAFHLGDAKQTPFEDNGFDLTVCRHTLQVIPEPEALIHEMVRLTKPGGYLYLLSEDYGMLHHTVSSQEILWGRCHELLLDRGTDLYIGRKTPMLMQQEELEQIEIHYLKIDTLNTPRDILKGMFQAWKDGYRDFLRENLNISQEEASYHFDSHIQAVAQPEEYLVWHVPVVTARKK